MQFEQFLVLLMLESLRFNSQHALLVGFFDERNHPTADVVLLHVLQIRLRRRQIFDHLFGVQPEIEITENKRRKNTVLMQPKQTFN